MLLSQGLISLAVSVAIPIGSAKKALPRGPLSAVEFPAGTGIYDYEVTVNISHRPDAVPRPRQRLPGIQVQKPLISSESSLSKVTRTLLGARQYCYTYCVDTGLCCGLDLDCCLDGCMLLGNTCCIGEYSCEPGYNCCGDNTCWPDGGDCCVDGSTCDTGTVCVIVNGILGCCDDPSCTELQGDETDDDTGTGSSALSQDESAPTTTFSIPNSVTLASVTPVFTLTDSTTPLTEINTVPTRSTVSQPSKLTSPPSAETNIASTRSADSKPSQLTPTGSARATALGSTASSSTDISTGTVKATGSGSLAPAGLQPARCAWAIGLTAVAVAVGAGMILL